MLCIKMLVMSLFTSYSNKKVVNLEEKINYKWAIMYIIMAILYICMSMLLNREINTTVFTLICISIMYTIIYKFNIMYSMLISAVSISINQILFYIASTFIYFPMRLLNIENKYLAFILIALVQAILLFLFWKIKRIRNGITFLKKWKNDEYINLLLLNASSAILFLIVIISNYQEGITSKFGVMLIIFAIVMFITIWISNKTIEFHTILAENAGIKNTAEVASLDQGGCPITYIVSSVFNNSQIVKDIVGFVVIFIIYIIGIYMTRRRYIKLKKEQTN